MTLRDNSGGQYGGSADKPLLISREAIRASAYTSLSTLWLIAFIVSTRTSTTKSPSATASSAPYQSTRRKRRERGFPRSDIGTSDMRIFHSQPQHASSYSLLPHDKMSIAWTREAMVKYPIPRREWLRQTPLA